MIEELKRIQELTREQHPERFDDVAREVNELASKLLERMSFPPAVVDGDPVMGVPSIRDAPPRMLEQHVGMTLDFMFRYDMDDDVQRYLALAYRALEQLRELADAPAEAEKQLAQVEFYVGARLDSAIEAAEAVALATGLATARAVVVDLVAARKECLARASDRADRWSHGI